MFRIFKLVARDRLCCIYKVPKNGNMGELAAHYMQATPYLCARVWVEDVVVALIVLYCFYPGCAAKDSKNKRSGNVLS